jgi:hypothetical protein
VINASGVDLSWTAPGDGTAFYYNVYRKGPGEPSFTKINPAPLPKAAGTTYADTGLTEHESYEYYVTSLDLGVSIESGESNHATGIASDALILAIVSVDTDKTTHIVTGAESAANITATANTDQATWTWTSTLNDVTGSGNAVTWKPSGNPQPQVVTISATAHYGAQQVSKDIKMFLTDQPILTQWGQNGKFVEWDPSAPSILNPNQPYRPLSFYVGNKKSVVFYDMWGVWCHWCRSEMPNLRHMWEYYKPQGADPMEGFWYVGEDDSGESVGTVSGFFSSPYWDSWNPAHPEIPNLTGWETYCGTDPTWQNPSTPHYVSGQYGYPSAVLFDRDGMIRWHDQESKLYYDPAGQGCEELCTLLSQLTGTYPVCNYSSWDYYLN